MKFIIILTICFSINAQQKYKIDDNIPLFMRSLLNQLSYEIKDFDETKIDSFIKSYYSNLDYLNNKIFVYLLNYSYQMSLEDTEINQETFNLAKKSLSKLNGEQVFSNLVYSSFINDLGNLITDRRFNSYMTQMKSSSNKMTDELKEFTKKIKIIKPWIDKLIVSTPQELDAFNKEINRELINKLLKLGSFLNKMAPSAKSPSKESYVIKVDKDLQKARKEVDALDFSLFPSKKDDYNSPESLPNPVNDWTPKK